MGGGFPWSQDDHKKIADDFQTRGLSVYMQLGSHYPDGSYLNLTDAYMVDQDGKPGVADKTAWAMNYSGDHWPQYSYTSEPFKQRLVKDFTTYVGKFADDHNIVGVILHNEAGFFWQTKHIYDYSPSALDAFHQWLPQQYATIDALNSRWGTTYTSFADVKPPGLPPESNLAAWMDWRHFTMQSVADFLKWEANFYQTLRPDVPRTTNLDGQLNNWYGYKLSNMLQYSAAMDHVGLDIYPGGWTTRTLIPYATDMVQGVAQGRPGDVLETNAFIPGEWKGCDEEQRGGFLRSEVWTMIGHGMSTILIWGFDTFDAPNDPFNARILACRDIAHQTAMIGMKDFHREKSRIALCVDPDSYLYYSGVEKSPLSQTSTLDQEVQGIYAALTDAGAQTDVIFAQQLNAGVWKNYDVIVMPSAMMMDEATAAQLKSFVAAGGTLVAAGPFATMDRWGKAQDTIPGFGLDQVFGSTVAKTDSSGSIKATNGGISVRDASALDAHGASVIGTLDDGSPGITNNNDEKGHAILIGGEVGQPYLTGTKLNGLSGLFTNLFQQASVVPTTGATVTGIPVDVSSLVDSRGNVLVVSSLATEHGKAVPPATDATIVYRGADPTSFRSAFVFPPTMADGGIVRSGPVPIALTPNLADKSVSFPLGEIKSALPVLLAKDAGPLLYVEAPQAVKNGQEEDLTVTCYNPSSAALAGQLDVRSGSGVTLDAGGPTSVSIPAYDQQKVVLKVKVQAPAPVARVPITVVLTPTGGSEIKGVPIDLEVQ
jgi:hypothetical protein